MKTKKITISISKIFDPLKGICLSFEILKGPKDANAKVPIAEVKKDNEVLRAAVQSMLQAYVYEEMSDTMEFDCNLKFNEIISGNIYGNRQKSLHYDELYIHHSQLKLKVEPEEALIFYGILLKAGWK